MTITSFNYYGKKSKCAASIIKTLDLLLLFRRFALPAFLLHLYLSFHHLHHNQAPRFFVVVFIAAAI
jgi:hypothetical protein